MTILELVIPSLMISTPFLLLIIFLLSKKENLYKSTLTVFLTYIMSFTIFLYFADITITEKWTALFLKTYILILPWLMVKTYEKLTLADIRTNNHIKYSLIGFPILLYSGLSLMVFIGTSEFSFLIVSTIIGILSFIFGFVVDFAYNHQQKQ